MTFRSWWLENRLKRTEQKLKKLRSTQRHLRQKDDEASKRKLHDVTHEVNLLVAQEERLKADLRAETEGGASPS